MKKYKKITSKDIRDWITSNTYYSFTTAAIAEELSTSKYQARKHLQELIDNKEVVLKSYGCSGAYNTEGGYYEGEPSPPVKRWETQEVLSNKFVFKIEEDEGMSVFSFTILGG